MNIASRAARVQRWPSGAKRMDARSHPSPPATTPSAPLSGSCPLIDPARCALSACCVRCCSAPDRARPCARAGTLHCAHRSDSSRSRRRSAHRRHAAWVCSFPTASASPPASTRTAVHRCARRARLRFHRSRHSDAASAARSAAAATVSRGRSGRADQSHGISERGCSCSRRASRARTLRGVCGVNIGKNAATPIARGSRRLPRMLPHRRSARRLRGDQRVVAEHRRSAAAAGGRPVAADRQRAGRSATTVAGCAARSRATAGEGVAGSRAGRSRAQRATGVRDRHRRDHRDQHDAEPQSGSRSAGARRRVD